MLPGRGLVASLLLSLLLLASPACFADHQPKAEAGRIDVPAGLQHPVRLQGQWGFAWQEFVDPAWDRLPTSALAAVPSSWNSLTAGGKPPGQDGWGSYALLVNCPQGTSLAVEAAHQRTATRVFVNGDLVAAHGEPGTSPPASHASIPNRVPITREYACPLRVTLHISNFDHRAGGFIRPLAVGPADVLARQRESRAIQDAAMLSTYLLTGLVALIFYAVRRRERTPLAFGLFCVAMAVYTDMIGERLLLRGWPAQVSWVTYTRVEYISWGAAMALFFVTLRGLFPTEIHRRMLQAVVGSLAVAGVAVLLLPPGVYSYLAQPGQFIAVLVGGYVAVAMVRADRRRQGDARVLLAGMVAIVAALVIDLVLIDVPGLDRKFAPVGFALFMLSPAVVIARRMSHALNAEERSRTLEENARLREDVERMSRHDLKTPLNSILGATRLLHDDPGLSTEQRELVGVLQRAGFRMLEMVNLSLGLFRMETGSYDFRPQAVDLREVVTRVLVDLHSHAEANAVTLHMQGSGGAPVYVRAEELLCYSIAANLVKNAVEAAGPGRQVSVTLVPGDPVALAIHNPGEVPPAIAARFFEKYVTSGKSGGTGLGTYSARLMARAQQGDLQMRTGAEGTTLTLSLPALQDGASVPSAAAPSRLPVAQWVADIPPRQVLVTDDDEYTRLVTRRFLPAPPFSVETAANGQAAIESLQRRWPDYLLIDMEMPVKDGVQTVAWLRAHEAAQGLPRCRVIMVSGNDDEASAARALQAGADRFLVKPVRREVLLATVRELEGRPAAAGPAATEPPASTPISATGSADEIVVVDPEWVEYFPDFLRGWRDTVDAMERALAAGDRQDLRFLAHRAAGGLSTMGMNWAAAQSRKLETGAMETPVQELEATIGGLRDYLKRVRVESA